jgi:hypothetical protein
VSKDALTLLEITINHYRFQQDSSPAQDSKRMKGWLKETFTEVWVE